MANSILPSRRLFAHVLAPMLVVVAAARPAAAETRTWTDSTGKYKIEAEFLEISDGKVRLERADGRTVSLPLAKLSTADREYLRELIKRRRAGEPDSDNPFESGLEQGAAGGPRGRRGAGPTTETGLREGDRVEVREGRGWQVGVVTGYDAQWRRIYVKLEESGRTVESFDDDHWIRLYDGGLAPDSGDGVGHEVTKVDLKRIRRVVPLGDPGESYQPDPAPAPVAWRPRPVALNPKTGFFEKSLGVSFAAPAARAAVAYTGGADMDDESSRIELCDLKTGRVIASLPAPRKLHLAALSPSGQRLLTVSEEETFTFGPLQLWEIDGEELKHVASWHASSDDDGRKLEWIGWADDEHILTLDDQGLTMWSAAGPRGVYQIAGERMQSPTFTPGGRQLALVGDKGIAIHDVASGELLKRIPLDWGHSRQAAFSPSGRLLAVTGQSTVDVVDLASGERLTQAFAPAAGGFGQGVCWLSEEHVLVGGADLVHVPSQMTVWTYQHNAEQVVPLAGRVWYCFEGHGDEPAALLPFQLPHNGVRPIADGELALKPGDPVALELELTFDMATDAAGGQQSVEEILADAIKRAGFLLADGAPNRLIARTAPGETQEVDYRTFGIANETQKVSVTQRIYELELIVDGEVVWKRRSVQGAPYHLSLNEGESVDQGVARVMQPNPGMFGAALPSRVLPLAAAETRSSTLTLRGVE